MKNKQRFELGKKAYIQLAVKVKAIDEDAGTLEAIFSTQTVDRHGDTVVQDGWDLKNFKKNPVILNSHNYNDATEVVGKASNVKVEGKKLIGKITFAVKQNPKAKIIFDLYAGGFLNAFSVGFMPKKFKENKDGSTDWYVIEESELLEVSAVSVPANAQALAKAKGIEVEKLKIKDQENDTNKEPDESTEDNKDKEADGEGTAPESDSGKGKQDGDNPEGGQQSDPDNGDEKPSGEEHTEDTAKNLKPRVSYKSKVIGALKSIESKEKSTLKSAAKIISQLIEGNPEGQALNEKTQGQIKKRRINQAIRKLMDLK